MTGSRLLYIGNKLASAGKTPTGIEILGPLLESEGFEVKYASDKKNRAVRFLDMVWAVLRYAGSSRFTLIDTYSTSNFWYAAVTAFLCRMLRVPYIPILHGGNLPERLAKNPRVCRFVFGKSAINVAPSAYLAKRFSDSGYGVAVIPNALCGDFPTRHRTSFGPKLLWVRSFASLYNPDMAVEVARLLAETHPQVKLCMVGPEVGNNRENAMRRAGELQIDAGFPGRLTKAEWFGLAWDFDIFINTSNIDNAPFSLLEAAALGLPIVSTNVGGIPLLFTDQSEARLVDAAGAEAMCAQILDLMAHPEKTRKMVENAFLVAENAKWSAVRGKWLEILE